MIYIVDDFYPNPDHIREKALELDFKDGVINGKRRHTGVRAFNPNYGNMVFLRNRFKSITGKKIVEFNHRSSNGSFNLGYMENHAFNWIHGDHTKDRGEDTDFWAAVIYLTPNPPKDSGTTLFEHTESGTIKQYQTEAPTVGPAFYGNVFKAKDNDNSYITNGWKPHLTIENRYNRCIIYMGKHFHTPTNSSFGHNKATGRLTQIGFWETEKW